jgi:hypothetical protein
MKMRDKMQSPELLVFKKNEMTPDNIQNCDSDINIPSSQT